MIRKNKKKSFLMVFLIFINIITILVPVNQVLALSSDDVDLTTVSITTESDASGVTTSGEVITPDMSVTTPSGVSVEPDESADLSEDLEEPDALDTEVTTEAAVTVNAPVITLIGDAEVTVGLYSTYMDPGVTITDDQDTGLVPTVTYTKDGNAVDFVNTFDEGTYIIHYNVTDAESNSAEEVTRTVIVGNIEDTTLSDSYDVDGYDTDLSFSLLSSEEVNDLLAVDSIKINGTQKVGNTLSSELLSVNGKVITPNSEITYEWYSLSSESSETSTLVGNSNTYALASSDAGQYIKLVVNYQDETFEAITLKIANTSPVNDDPQTGMPTVAKINGILKVGNTLNGELTMENGDEVNASSEITYKWYRLSVENSVDGVLVGDSKTYKLVNSDGGQYIKLVISYKSKTFENITSKIANISSSGHSSSNSNNNSTGSPVGNQTGETPNDPTKLLDGWKNNSTGWEYIENGKPVIGWKQINGLWYLMNSTGTMVTGWQEANGIWYFLKTDGAMATGWQESNGNWYYLRNDGAMATDWLEINGTWYYLNGDGAMATGWQKIKGAWYYLNSNGSMATGWQEINETWYYLKRDGSMEEN